MKFLFSLSMLLAFALPVIAQVKATSEKFKTEIEQAEKNFNELATSKSISEAFYAFADENAVIKRENDTLIKGRDAIRNYYKRLDSAKVTWSPDHIEVSADGSMASTFGRYVWTTTDASGKTQTFKGVFHTVWKRQKDGSWKYIWD